MSASIFSYGAAGIAYGLLIVLLLVHRRAGGRQGLPLLLAVTGASLWGLSIAAASALTVNIPLAVHVADALRSLLWTLCLVAMLPPRQGGRRLLSGGAMLLCGLVIISSLMLGRQGDAQLALLGMSIMGCLAVEQIVRNSSPEQRAVLKLFLWFIGITFCYDLFVFSHAVLFGGLDPVLWVLRGLVAASAVPFFVLAAKRHPEWQDTLFISRQVAFYTATLTGVGVYLIAMALMGTVIRQLGGNWGLFLQLGFLLAALGVLATCLLSARLRTLMRVFISKHFYHSRYEYRTEWLRLIKTLSESGSALPLDQRCIKAIATIIGSPGGQLWLDSGPPQHDYEPFAAWRAPFPPRAYSSSSALVRFLNDRQWVIDSDEYERDPELYDHTFAEDSELLPQQSIFIPLMHQQHLLGFMRLIRPIGHEPFNFEDHDLLKTAGRQVAAFLAHDLAREQLSETQQFEAFNKLSAFVMHDLKNLLNQQGLLVANSKKHQHNPEFVADLIRTVEGGVQRMRWLLLQLEQQRSAGSEQRVELGGLLQNALEPHKEGGVASFRVDSQEPCWVRANPERLSNVLVHLALNAKQAAGKNGNVIVTLQQDDGQAILEIRDDGEGMSQEFLRRRLFKPFDSTKGDSGMGLGAYQAREVVRSLGGSLVVESEAGSGTIVRLKLPTVASAGGRPNEGLQAAALDRAGEASS